MRFSLIVATVGRTTELQRLLASLEGQTHRDFEVIVVDQNRDDRLVPTLNDFSGRLELYRIPSPAGLSRARNVGRRFACGDVICFPDDDCEYSEDVLRSVNRRLLHDRVLDGIIAESVDCKGRRTLPWPARPGRLTKSKCWLRAISYTIFLRREAVEYVGDFDEELGVGSGSPWGACEDSDFVLRALQAGFRVDYDPTIHVCHPRMFDGFDGAALVKRHSYARGDGKLWQKHPMPLWWDVLLFTVPIGRALLSTVRFNLQETYFHWLTFSGRMEGFLSPQRSRPHVPPLSTIGAVHPGPGAAAVMAAGD